MVTEAMDLNTEPDWGRAMGPDTDPSSNTGLDVFMYHSGSTGHSDQHGPGVSTDLVHKVATGGGPHPGHPCALGDNMSHGCQHRP